MQVLVPDYGCGNLASIVRMCEKVGGRCRIIDQPDFLVQADKIILAGVGAFDHGMEHLRATGWDAALNEAVLQRRVPVLGICLGMQLMCRSSEEGKQHGLGWITGNAKRFSFPENSALRVPHMGWNTVSVAKLNPLIDQESDEQRFYFVHSYHVACDDTSDVLATANFGGEFVAAFQRGNIFGVQFHPEKSHRFGMALIDRFLRLSAC